MKEVQAELIAAQKAEIERLQGIVEEEAEADRILREAAELITEEERAAKWADDELDRKERIQEMVIEVTELDKNATIELQEDGRVKLLLPVNQR